MFIIKTPFPAKVNKIRPRKDKGPEHRINREIDNDKVRVISAEGEQLGILDLREAIRQAEVAGFDLVEVAPTAEPPVCKIMDYGQYRYAQVQKSREAKKKNKILPVKEVKLSMTIDENDRNTKVKAIRSFIEKGHKVKVSMRLRGREASYSKFGFEVMQKIVQAFNEEEMVVDAPAVMMGPKAIIMVLAPKPKK